MVQAECAGILGAEGCVAPFTTTLEGCKRCPATQKCHQCCHQERIRLPSRKRKGSAYDISWEACPVHLTLLTRGDSKRLRATCSQCAHATLKSNPKCMRGSSGAGQRELKTNSTSTRDSRHNWAPRCRCRHTQLGTVIVQRQQFCHASAALRQCQHV